VTFRSEVHVVCPHDRWRFAPLGESAWTINMQHAERVPYPDGAERWHHSMRCDWCRLTVPVVNPDRYGPILDQLARVENPAVRRVSPTVVEVPLKLMAAALGTPRKLRD
jgi:hypothetical protein